MGRKAQGALHGFENLRSSTMEDVAANVAHGQIIVLKEALDGATELCADKFRNVRGQDNVEAAVINIPSHQMLCVGIKRGAGCNDAWAGIFDARRLFG